MLKQILDRIKTALGLNKNPGCQTVVSKEVSDFMNSLPHEEQAKLLNVRGPDLGQSATLDHPQLGKTGQGAHLGQMSFNPTAVSQPTDADRQTAALMALVPKGPWDRQVPTEAGGYLLPPGSRWKPSSETKVPRSISTLTGQPQTIDTSEELECFLEMKLTPQLATVGGKVVESGFPMSPLLKDMLEIPCHPTMIVANKDQEPDMLDPADRRKLTYKWLEWCYITHGISLHQAWEIGAKSMIDNEFAHGTMRQNVEILPWDVMDPYVVKIKYHDPLDKNDPWFEKDEE